MTDQNTLNNQTAVQESDESVARREARIALREELHENLKQVFDSALANKDHGGALRSVELRANLGGLF